MVIYVLMMFTLFCDSANLSPFTTKQYRTDYEYNEHSDAFYKLHIETRSPERAEQCCQVEGAELMLPKTLRDIEQVHGMLKKYPDLGDIVMIASDKQEHDPVDEPALVNLEPEPKTHGSDCEVITRAGGIATNPCWRYAPFICKVEARAAIYDDQCGVYGKDYISRISTTGSCYKIPSVSFTWNEAFAECAAEGAHLVVLNSQGEHEVVRDLLNSGQLPAGLTSSYFFFAGIRADRPKDGASRVFRTVLNQTLEEAGYAEWSENEPNNYQHSEFCGSIFKTDGKYNDLACFGRYGFICEKEMRTV
ncbi:hypothetical protein MSG28_003215 [Choristoneura fumiferana]|uniref:Uncharacterized protein n=1 Tax=Choristoneura fumiferana TaxID=7141 RepID=A0ACC0KE11_CHOFU|nr:hypothetical protein MSG28_003215 [Choristoneura fumiferana]